MVQWGSNKATFILNCQSVEISLLLELLHSLEQFLHTAAS